jgi:hypothetical protein
MTASLNLFEIGLGEKVISKLTFFSELASFVSQRTFIGLV